MKKRVIFDSNIVEKNRSEKNVFFDSNIVENDQSEKNNEIMYSNLKHNGRLLGIFDIHHVLKNLLSN